MSDIVFLLLIALGFAVAVAAIFAGLNMREKGKAAAGQPRRSSARLVFASIFLVIALITGGIALIFLPDTLKGPQYVSIELVIMVFGVPFLSSLLLFLIVMRRRGG